LCVMLSCVILWCGALLPGSLRCTQRVFRPCVRAHCLRRWQPTAAFPSASATATCSQPGLWIGSSLTCGAEPDRRCGRAAARARRQRFGADIRAGRRESPPCALRTALNPLEPKYLRRSACSESRSNFRNGTAERAVGARLSVELSDLRQSGLCSGLPVPVWSYDLGGPKCRPLPHCSLQHCSCRAASRCVYDVQFARAVTRAWPLELCEKLRRP
jgi:hypothetical protein